MPHLLTRPVAAAAAAFFAVFLWQATLSVPATALAPTEIYLPLVA